jgi:hypothetical protein
MNIKGMESVSKYVLARFRVITMELPVVTKLLFHTLSKIDIDK